MAADKPSSAEGQAGELLPCPFCGGEAYVSMQANGYMAGCTCSPVGPWTGLFATRTEAIAAWNTRTPSLEAGAVENIREAARLLLLELNSYTLECVQESAGVTNRRVIEERADDLRAALAGLGGR